MKKVALILSVLVLFQSCYSYKTFDIKGYEVIKNKKIKVELNDKRKIKGKITEFKNDKIVVENSKEIIEIPVSKIQKIKKREYSYVKTDIAKIGIHIIVFAGFLYALFTNLYDY